MLIKGKKMRCRENHIYPSQHLGGIFTQIGEQIWPEYEVEGEFSAEQLKAIDNANRKTPCRVGMYIDPYSDALDDVMESGVTLFWTNTSGARKKDESWHSCVSPRAHRLRQRQDYPQPPLPA